MDKAFYFYHVTSKAIRTRLTTTKALVPQIHSPRSEWMWLLDSKYKNKIPKGVWFCSTLYNGGLPTISPYGTERVRMPIEKVLGQLGGGFSLYHARDAQVQANTYVRLMVVKDGDDFDCLEYMEKINPRKNDWLQLVSNSEFKVAKRPKWVEIYYPYEVDITDGEWDSLD
ncbi:uncharacterized protein LOC110440290 [Mizuhopecten yessoensis]|uniref:uncharacterized protein LOC110440290 n=1 Tax=Mizuhopecten yessoensis TaxID=6573 RepID=UPI000B4585CB|nr:uncharacterized protein LOC110440290 [Mizuhopecten yessoensis]